MTSPTKNLLTHWCRSCDAHHSLHRVRQVMPAEHTAEGEAEVLVCPSCGSYEIEHLQEADHAE